VNRVTTHTFLGLSVRAAELAVYRYQEVLVVVTKPEQLQLFVCCLVSTSLNTVPNLQFLSKSADQYTAMLSYVMQFTVTCALSVCRYVGQ